MNMPKSRGLHAKIPSPKAIFIGFLLVTVKVLNSCVQKQYLPLSHFLFKKIYFCSSTSTLRFSRFLISSLISEMKASRPFWPSSPLKRLLTDTTPSSSSFGADYQHIRNLLQSVPHGSCSRSSQPWCRSRHGYRPLSAQQELSGHIPCIYRRSAVRVTCTGASQVGNAPAKCSIRIPMKRSMEPNTTR